MKTVSIKTALGSAWDIQADVSPTVVPDRPIWFHIFAGPMSGGAHLTIAECDALSHLFATASSEATRHAEKLAEARFELSDAATETTP